MKYADLSIYKEHFSPAIHRIQEAGALDIYSQQLGSIDLLTAREEQVLGRKINRVLTEMLVCLIDSERGLNSLEALLEEYLALHQGRNSLAAKKWGLSEPPEYVENLVLTLIDTLRVMEHLDLREAPEAENLAWNLAALVTALAVGRHKLVELIEKPDVYPRAPYPKRGLQRYFDLRNELVHRNLRLVYQVAMKFRHTGVTFDDLIQEGNMGLITAVDRFNFHRGFRFSTYAMLCIQNVIKTALQKRYHLISRPSYLQEKLAKIRRAETVHINRFGKRASLAWISDETGIDIATLERIRAFPKSSVSLNQPLKNVASDDLEFDLPDKGEDASASAQQQQLRRLVERCAECLSEKEFLVLRLRFGIDCRREHTLQEVADQLRVSVERTRQLQKAGLTKLREEAEGLFSPDQL